MSERLTRSELGEQRDGFSLITGFTEVGVKVPRDIGLPPFHVFDPLIGRRLPGGLTITDDELYRLKINQYPNVILLLQNSDELLLQMIDSKNFILWGPFQDEKFYKRLPYIAYNIGERSRQESQNMVTLHGAAVCTEDGRSLLILGDKGSGKTLLTLVFCLYHEFRLIGNDLVLLQMQTNDFYVRAGTQIFDVRQGVIEHYLTQLGIQHLHRGHPYEKKITLMPEELGIPIAQGRQELLAIIRINIHPFNDNTTIEIGAQREREILRLRENLSRYIRGVVTPLALDEDSMGGYFPSMDSKELVELRDEMIRKIISTNFIYASGNNPNDVAAKIINAVL